MRDREAVEKTCRFKLQLVIHVKGSASLLGNSAAALKYPRPRRPLFPCWSAARQPRQTSITVANQACYEQQRCSIFHLRPALRAVPWLERVYLPPRHPPVDLEGPVGAIQHLCLPLFPLSVGPFVLYGTSTSQSLLSQVTLCPNMRCRLSTPPITLSVL